MVNERGAAAVLGILFFLSLCPEVLGQEVDSLGAAASKPLNGKVLTDSSVNVKTPVPLVGKRDKSVFDKRLFFVFSPIYEGEIFSKFLDPLSDLDYYNYNKSFSDFKANIFAVQKRKGKRQKKYDFGYGLQMSRTRSLRDDEIGVGSIVTFDRRLSQNKLNMGVVYLPDFATFDKGWDLNFSHSIFLEIKFNLNPTNKKKKKP